MNFNESQVDIAKLNPIPLVGGGYMRGAHHPHCDRYHHHLIWIFGHPLCLGCTCMYSGAAIGIATCLSINWSSVPVPQWLFIHLILLIPTLIQPWFQKKPFKMGARFLLGVSASSYLISGLFFIEPAIDIWIFRLSISLLFAATYRSLKYIRNRYTYSPCQDCPLGMFPTCDWNLPRLLSENPDIELLKVINNSASNEFD